MFPNRQKILITGASGLLGGSLMWAWRQRCALLGVYHAHPVRIPGAELCGADLSDRTAFRKIAETFRPDAVIHCAALTDLDFCERNPEAADRVNIGAVQNIVFGLRSLPAKLVFISTDAVYDGRKGNYTEEDPTAPVNHYGRTKCRGEEAALEHPGCLVLRTSLFGWNSLPKESLSEWILNRLMKGETIRGFFDVHFSALYTMELADLMEACLEKDLSGVYVAASRGGITKYDFAKNLAAAFGLDGRLVEKASVDDLNFSAKRGKNLSLSPARLERALGREMPTFEDSIRRLHRDYLERLPSLMRAT